MNREIKFIVLNNGKLSNPTRQWGGMQFEDKATKVTFDISAINYAGLSWRIDFDSPSAAYNPGSVTEVVDGTVSRYLECDMTRYGGNIQVTLVGTKVDAEYNSEQVVYSFPAVVYLTDVNQHEPSEGDAARSISAAELSALSAADRAEQSGQEAIAAAKDAETSRKQTENARRALEEGAEFVFLGGDSKSKGKIELAVDDELSDTSENPIQNQAVTKAIRNKRYLLIGDSYGQGARPQVGVTGWAPLFKEKMGLSDDDCIINTLGGSGFCNGVSKEENKITIDSGVDSTKKYRFIDLLTCTATIKETTNNREIIVSEIFPVNEPETITDIIVCGGYNDKGSKSAEIANAISDFIAAAKKLYPNALVSIGMVGCSGKTSEAIHTQQLAANALQGYCGLLGSCKYPYRYLNNVEYALKVAPAYMYEEKINEDGTTTVVSDGTHPTAAGYVALANAICKAVKGGFTVGYNSYRTTVIPVDGITVSAQPDVMVKINGSLAEVYMTSCTFNFEEGRTVSANERIELCSFDPNTSLITGTHHDPEDNVYNLSNFFPVTGHYQTPASEGGKFKLFTGRAGIVNGKLCLIPHILKDDNSGWAVNVPMHALQIHLVHLISATNTY